MSLTLHIWNVCVRWKWSDSIHWNSTLRLTWSLPPEQLQFPGMVHSSMVNEAYSNIIASPTTNQLIKNWLRLQQWLRVPLSRWRREWSQPVYQWHVMSMSSPPAVLGFLYWNFRCKTIATQFSHDDRLSPIPICLCKISPILEIKPEPWGEFGAKSDENGELRRFHKWGTS